MVQTSRKTSKVICAFLLLMAIAGCQIGSGVSQMEAPPASSPPQITQPSYVAPHDQLIATGRPLDLVLDNSGSPPKSINFFKLMSESGEEAVTRYGSFHLDDNGTIVHSSGMFLSPMITLPEGANDIQIREDGLILFQLPGSTTTWKAGPILLASYEDPASLINMGDGLFRPGGGERMVAPLTDKSARIYQGYLEKNFETPEQ